MERPHPALTLIAGLAVLTASCTSPPHLDRVMRFTPHDGALSVVLMPPDVDLEERGLTGVSPRIDWGAEARQRVETIARDILESHSANVRVYLATDEQSSAVQDAAITQQRAMFRALAERTIYAGSGYVVGARRWSLGSAARDLRQGSDARYALFLAFQDYYSSTGRVVGQVALGLAFVASLVFLGIPLTPPDFDDPGPVAAANGSYAPTFATGHGGMGCPEQTGYASLIDLETGDVVWLNRVSEGCSDLRTADALRRTLELLLTGIT
jgi:hypothetical protein